MAADRPPPPAPSGHQPDHNNDESPIEHVIEEVRELEEELVEAIEETWIARKSIAGYLWLIDKAPKSTRGRVTLAVVAFVVLMAPSIAMVYATIKAGRDSTEAWFGGLGYAGIFLANLASTATLFIPVPGLTAAAQALIASSGQSLNPLWVGIAGGLGMALGEVTAYVAGMATAFIVSEEKIEAPRRLQRVIERVTRWVSWLMAHYGMPTLFTLSVIPNPLFEVAGWTAGATRYSFWRFMGAVTPGKVLRGILLAYIGEKLIFG